jgi:hypothetical protein
MRGVNVILFLSSNLKLRLLPLLVYRIFIRNAVESGLQNNEYLNYVLSNPKQINYSYILFAINRKASIVSM